MDEEFKSRLKSVLLFMGGAAVFLSLILLATTKTVEEKGGLQNLLIALAVFILAAPIVWVIGKSNPSARGTPTKESSSKTNIVLVGVSILFAVSGIAGLQNEPSEAIGLSLLIVSPLFAILALARRRTG